MSDDQWGPVEPSLTLESEQEVKGGSGISGGRVVAGVIGVLVLLGGAVFAVTQAGSSGPGSAEEAVRELLDAASDEDVLGLLAALDPGERDALRGPVEDLFGELERLEVFSDDFRLDGVAGIDIEFTDVELREEAVRDDLVRVYFTGGEVTTGIDGSEVPLGSFVDDTLDALEVDRSELDELQESETSEITDDGTFVVARNGGDGWRVSLGYTAAEYARLAAGLPLPTDGIDPIGADSPEAAVEGMFQAVAAFDLTGAIARLTPGEARALQDYAPLFLDRALGAIEEETRDIEASIDELELRSETDGDRGRVFVESFAVSVDVEGETASVAVDAEGCFTISGSLLEEELEGTPFVGEGPVCPDELAESYDDALEGSGFPAEQLPTMPMMPSFDAAGLGISTARVDGEWYVAPIATLLDSAVTGLRAIEKEHLEGFRDFVQSFAFGGFMLDESFTVDEFGDPIEGDDFLEDELGATTTTMLEPGTGTMYDPELFSEMALELAAGDPMAAQCIESELVQTTGDLVVYELVDAWQFGYEPSTQAQAALEAAMARCGAG